MFDAVGAGLQGLDARLEKPCPGAAGSGDSGTARLAAAVTAYRAALAALQERTRERVPLQWAMTQNNLGTALETLGERESETARLAV